MSGTSKPELRKQLFLCTGVFITKGKKEATGMLPVTQDELEEGVSHLEKKWEDASYCFKKILCSAGNVYEFETSNDGRTLHGRGTFVQQWPGEKFLAEIYAASKSRAQFLNVVKAEKDAKRRNMIDEQLEPIRRAYKRLPAPQKRQLLALVVERLTR